MEETFSQFSFGSGLIIEDEILFSPDLRMRPCSWKGNHFELEARATTQFDYGILCSFADLISFEIEVSANTQKDAAIKIWNHQWLFLLLAILERHPIYHLFVSNESLNSIVGSPARLSNLFISDKARLPAKVCNKDTQYRARKLYPNFKKLIDDKRFSYAASVAAHNHNEPNASVRLAAIWSGIEALFGFDHELRYRIAMTATILLKGNMEDKEGRFAKFKKLYDLRSKCVHGANVPRGKIDEGINDSLELLCELIEFYCERGALLSSEELTLLPLRQKL